MAVVENAGISVVTSSNQTDSNAPPEITSVDHIHPQFTKTTANLKSTKPTDSGYHLIQSNSHQHQLHRANGDGVSNALLNSNPAGKNMNSGNDGEEGFKREMRDLAEMLSKLNPLAEEFVPPSLAANGAGGHHRLMIASPHEAAAGFFGYNANGFVMQQPVNSGVQNGNSFRRKKNGYGHGKRRTNNRTSMAQREDVIKRTVYVSDIDHQVTEEQLAALFIHCGQVVDCRVCGDPNSVLRFAFVEFTDEEGARNALSLAGTMLGYYPVRVLPSKTAIAPVNPTFLPRSEDEREMCARTIYCTNIDKKVTQADVKLFFESICGEVHRLRLLGDYQHTTRIAFVEFVMAESAIAALNCSGAVLGSLPIRVSPSKTPVRPRSPRQSLH
ncbi:polyadenylate-binding protein-interacting protein 12-like [Olea europaea var. sylvestris]|uniref:polyadenylate-binding protein-interacting protein 12-like n=1 Tax=Olea europaea var. sylvestris TaxID=158386 RepID=UPI000C1D12C4|nr:polyadenylate-binding protein-interacting protein 12-like [Olea europaea var. sylvestris]XP_022891143.1 polyadenylate-binding protein-interacting protein 12-like [Olea europaea var. sylvestris]